MSFPTATKTTSFIAGLTFSAPLTLLAILKTANLVSYGIDQPRVVAFFVIYLLLTLSVFVLDVRSFVPKQLKTRIPLVYFPTDQAGVEFLFTVFGRILVWVAGVVAGVAMLVPLWYFLQKR
ncbi:hypothetical protein [Methylomonas fluvii]|uniref:Uncharacterized protein n=1 Tax=Methylomonas fluvii TaxID=1854564 RepID=A0ABR9DH26_9GAMM|nr:hypothetical protein [Methylomonas fluvii]MBD9362398.1 hypothetical protein [Methylomonas fluvii]